MKNAVIIHGAPDQYEYLDPDVPSPSNHHWLPWLQKQLIVHGYAAHTPEIPKCWAPHYPTWKKEFERFEITRDTLLVGHSCGGGFLTRWLSENKSVRVDRVVLVAPWIDPSRRRTRGFFNFKIDPLLAKRARNGFVILNSDNDAPEIQESAQIIHETVRNCCLLEFHEYGHFCLDDMQTDEFPELLEMLIEPLDLDVFELSE